MVKHASLVRLVLIKAVAIETRNNIAEEKKGNDMGDGRAYIHNSESYQLVKMIEPTKLAAATSIDFSETEGVWPRGVLVSRPDRQRNE